LQLWGEYVEARIAAGPFSLTPGLRFDQIHWRRHARWSIDPRLWARYAFGASAPRSAYAACIASRPMASRSTTTSGIRTWLSWRAGPAREWSTVQRRLERERGVFYNRRGSLIVTVDAGAARGRHRVQPAFENNGIAAPTGSSC